MKSKDTVIVGFEGDSIMQSQAEISFKTGEQTGIEEVVEWIEKQNIGDKSCVVVTIDDWDTQLKEWGITNKGGIND